jgi:hypothetical protein
MRENDKVAKVQDEDEVCLQRQEMVEPFPVNKGA